MNQILLSFDSRTQNAWGTPVLVEVFDESLARVADPVVRLSERDQRVQVPGPGRYFVRAELPSGDNLSGYVDIESQQAPLVLKSEEGSPHEWLAWAYASQSVRRTSKRTTEGQDPPHLGVRPTELFRMCPSSMDWSLTKYGDVVLTGQDGALVGDARVLHALEISRYISNDQDWFPLYLRCQILEESSSSAGRLIAIPPLRRTTILLLRTDAEPSCGTTVRALVKLDNPGAEALLGYMGEGSVDAAGRIAPEVVRNATDLLREKREDPVSATIAAYFKFLSDRVDQRDWLRNLADWFPALPDGAVIFGSYLLRETGNPNARVEARNYLIEAVNRGIPIYTMGLRLLFDNLRQLVEEGLNDDELSMALAKVRVASAYADWRSATTSFQIPDHSDDLPFRIY